MVITRRMVHRDFLENINSKYEEEYQQLHFFSMIGVLEINFNLSMDFVPQVKIFFMYATLHVCTLLLYLPLEAR